MPKRRFPPIGNLADRVPRQVNVVPIDVGFIFLAAPIAKLARFGDPVWANVISQMLRMIPCYLLHRST